MQEPRDSRGRFLPVLDKNQRQVVLDHFKAYASLSGLEADALYKIRDLPKVISDLKKLGAIIAAERRIDPCGQRYNRYVFVGFQKQAA